MSLIERFESGWDNDGYLTSLGSAEEADFDRLSFGTYDIGEDNFTDGDSYTDPDFGIRLIIRVTTSLPNVGTSLFVTYVDQDANPGNGSVIALPAMTADGTEIVATLDTGDTGIQDVTAVTHSPTIFGGVVELFGAHQLVEDFEDGWVSALT